jgi:hypothetical protein
MPLDEHAICHEAGHAVAALHLGFHVERIAMTDGRPNSKIEIDSKQKTLEECCVVLAGGIAGEKFFYGDYNKEASQSDQNMISERGGGDIKEYLVEALKIMSHREICLREFKQQLKVGWVKGAAEAQWESNPDCFDLLSHDKIQRIWKDACRKQGK